MDMSPQGSGRFLASLAVLAVLAVLVWWTMDPGRYQQLTWLLIGFFAFRIVLMRLRPRYSSDGALSQADRVASDTADR